MPEANGWVVVFESRRRGVCHDRALVLDALGIPHLIADGPRRSALLLVPSEHAARADAQLRQYAAENQAGGSAPAPLRLHGHGIPGIIFYVVVLIALYLCERRFVGGADWLAAGGLDGAAVRAGEWWRVVTALTLHADLGHLSANLLFGMFFGAFAGQYLGSGVGWATILVAAALGNVFDVLLLPPDHRAIGASTAVFAALGVIAAYVWLTALHRGVTWARRWAPVVGALLLLAYIGTGDAQTDAVAHLTGFVAGVTAGAAFGLLRPRFLESRRVQLGAAAGTLATLAACWWLAIEAGRSSLA